MSPLEERRKRGADLIKRYRSVSGADSYACAADAIADILLFVAQTPEEGIQLLQSAEMDFRSTTEGERFLTEG
ncbi:MAG: hypothetical protein JO097_11960 [Acidobacteriaceae bacterium]|nr:hypothetical protein [Acidobacteriaceae bacterium]MBV9295703.1 hypothetical protein [Acidobacteriaceae bacterium]MBV9766455.1 hypothetical protein [Acidobacteriaceae bacterium]